MKKNDRFFILYMSSIIFIILFFLVGHISKIVDMDPTITFITAFVLAGEKLTKFDFNIFPLTMTFFRYMLYALGLVALITVYLIFEMEKNKRTMPGKEYGSAKWLENLRKYNKKYTDPVGSPKNDGDDNVIFTDEISLSLNSFKTKRNLNTLINGGTGAGKSRYFVKPNLLQANTSFVITDPAGELLESTGDFLEKKGYEIKSFNLTDMSHSNCYNPFNFIRDSSGVLMLINCLIKNTTPPGKNGGDPFWEKSETALLQALFFYLIEEQPPEKQNFTSVMKLLRSAEVNENDASSKSPLDRIFDDVYRKNPNSMAYKSYMTFKMGAGKTLKSILISCAVRLQAFDLPEVANLIRTDTIHPENNIDLKTLGDKKTALYVIIPAADDTYNFIVSMMYYQLFETLYFHAETEMPYSYIINDNNKKFLNVCKSKDNAKDIISLYHTSEIEKYGDKYRLVNGDTVLAINKYKETLEEIKEKYKDAVIKKFNAKKLPIHVRFMLDEFANIGQIPDFTKKLSTMRKYEMSCSIIIQNLAQLKMMYKDEWEGVIGNCDSFLFLGGQEASTLKYISENVLGKMTEIVRNNSRNMGQKSGSSLSYNRAGRTLMEPDELGKMDDDDCILKIRGLDPYKGKKYNYVRHKNYKYTGDASDEFRYDYKENFNNKVLEGNAVKYQIEKNNAEKFTNNQTSSGDPIVTQVTPLNMEEIAKRANIDTIEELKEKISEVHSSPNYISESSESDDIEDTTEEWDFNVVG